jgi:hypothetical protein
MMIERLVAGKSLPVYGMTETSETGCAWKTTAEGIDAN